MTSQSGALRPLGRRKRPSAHHSYLAPSGARIGSQVVVRKEQLTGAAIRGAVVGEDGGPPTRDASRDHRAATGHPTVRLGESSHLEATESRPARPHEHARDAAGSTRREASYEA